MAKVMTTREKMLERKKKLTEKTSKGSLIFPKEGTMRVRLLSQGPDKELGVEVIQFYSQKTGGIISPASFGDPCPFMEKFKELKNSSNEDDQELAKLLTPRRRYVIGGTIYKDEKGKEIDEDRIGKPILIPSSVYQDIIDLYLDEDDWGDMTDPDSGYDIKITRSGKGKMDTTYSVTACPKGKNPKSKFLPTLDLEEILKNEIPSYDELEEKLNDFLNGSDEEPEDEDAEERPKKKKVKDPDKKKLKKKKKVSDI